MAILITFSFLLQGCAVYDKKPVSLEEATTDHRVKIITKEGIKEKYKSIYFKDDGELYALSNKKYPDTVEIIVPTEQVKVIHPRGSGYSKDIIKTIDGMSYTFDHYHIVNDSLVGKQFLKHRIEMPLSVDTVEEIFLYNPKKSTAATVFLTIGSVATGLILFSLVTFSTDCYGQGCISFD